MGTVKMDAFSTGVTKSVSSDSKLEEDNASLLKSVEGATDGSYGMVMTLVHGRRELKEAGFDDDFILSLTFDEVQLYCKALLLETSEDVFHLIQSKMNTTLESMLSIAKDRKKKDAFMKQHPEILAQRKSCSETLLKFFDSKPVEDQLLLVQDGITSHCAANSSFIVNDDKMYEKLVSTSTVRPFIETAITEKFNSLFSQHRSYITFRDFSGMDPKKMWWIDFQAGCNRILIPAYEFVSDKFVCNINKLVDSVYTCNDDCILRVKVAYAGEEFQTMPLAPGYLDFAKRFSLNFSERFSPMEELFSICGFKNIEELYPKFPDLPLAIYKGVKMK